MTNYDLLTDDYVAELLASDARDTSLKYSAVGLEAYRSTKKPADKPKPNTRFLRHVIKDTDAHNAALLAREAAESRARLEQLDQAEEERQKALRSEPQKVRSRQLGDIQAILGGRRDRRVINGAAEECPRRSYSKDISPRKDARSEDGENQRTGKRPRRRDGESQDGERRSTKTRAQERKDKVAVEEAFAKRESRDRGELPSDDLFSTKTKDRGRDPSRDEGRERRRCDSGSPEAKRRSRSPERGNRTHRTRSPLGEHRLPSAKSVRRRAGTSQDSGGGQRQDNELPSSQRGIKPGDEMGEDSDPLEEFLGPLPPPRVRARGRGAASGPSSMDRRFSESYDPKSDVQLPEDGDRWDQAVEEYRDRQKWIQHQEERLRSAGIGSEEIQRWRKGGQKSEEDVRWSKYGEKREWDRGKSGF